MSVFMAYSDEAGVGDPSGEFLIAEYVAHEDEWPWIASAWQQRVWDGPPKIPYLHMTEIRRESWRTEHKISFNDQGVTSGSQSTVTEFSPGGLRQAVDTARDALFQMASQYFNVPASRLTAQNGVFTVMGWNASNSVSYGQLLRSIQSKLELSGLEAGIDVNFIGLPGTAIPNYHRPHRHIVLRE